MEFLQNGKKQDIFETIPMKITSKAPKETLQLGSEMGKHCVPGDIFLLTGELGSGKTLFSKGVATALGIPANAVISPSFTIILEHKQGKYPFYHIDFYRLHSAEELEDLGLEMYFSGEGVVVIEWADRVSEALPRASLTVDFNWGGKKTRYIEIKARTERWKKIIADTFIVL